MCDQLLLYFFNWLVTKLVSQGLASSIYLSGQGFCSQLHLVGFLAKQLKICIRDCYLGSSGGTIDCYVADLLFKYFLIICSHSFNH